MLHQGVFMRRCLPLIGLVLLLFGADSAVVPAQQAAPQQQPQTKEQTVYITNTGKKYHRAGCRYLSHSKILVSLKDAKANGYTVCSVCRPPQ
jgi:micrococcal nuclease